MKVITEFTHSVRLFVTTSRILKEVNKYHIGREGMKTLDEEWPKGKGGIDMQKVHQNLHSTYSVPVVVQVMEDGSLRLKDIKND